MTELVGCARNLVYSRDYSGRREMKDSSDKQTMVPTLDGSDATTSGLSEDTNDGYSAKVIAEQSSMTGLEVVARYTRTCVELCMRNWMK